MPIGDDVICEGCGIVYKQPKKRPSKFCGKKCFAKFRLSLVAAMAAKRRSDRVAKFCEHCGKRIRSRAGISRRRFCSNDCSIAFKESEVPFKTYSKLSFQRKAARIRFKNACAQCGYNEIPEILQIHHKDHDPRNGSPDNIDLLCPNCHESEHFKAKTGRFSLLPKTKKPRRETYKFARSDRSHSLTPD